MVTGCTLNFLVPQADAYVAALRKSAPHGPVLLIGTGELADRIAATKAAQRSKLQHITDFPTTIPTHCVLILTETDEERLANQLLACIDCTDLTILAPITARHFSRKPLFIVSIPKGGTHLVYELAKALGYSAGVELPDFPQPQTWYCVEYSNSHTVARDFFVDTVRRSPFGNRHHPFPDTPTLFAYRHPLDILVSEAHYYCRDGKTVFSGYFAGEDFSQRVRSLIDDEWLLGTLRERIGGFSPWLRFPNVIPVSFEELVGGQGGGSDAIQHRLIWSILLKLQVDGNVQELSERVFNRKSATFHEGQIGAFRTQLPAALINELARSCKDVLDVFGYSINADPPITTHASRYLKRPMQYATEIFDSLAINAESNFMGCNLVRYGHQFYAMPISAGNVDFQTLQAEQLAALPSAPTLSSLKNLLLIGSKVYQSHVRQLEGAGRALQDKKPLSDKAYWGKASGPQLLDAYHDFNLLQWRGQHLALRQSIGPVDLTEEDLQNIQSRYTDGDVLVAESIDTLKLEIDTRAITTRLESAIELLRALVGEQGDQLQKKAQDYDAIQSSLLVLQESTESQQNRTTQQLQEIGAGIAQCAAQNTQQEQIVAQNAREQTVRADQLTALIASQQQLTAQRLQEQADRGKEFCTRIEQLQTQIQKQFREQTDREKEIFVRIEQLQMQTQQQLLEQAALNSQAQELLNQQNQAVQIRLRKLESNKAIVLTNYLARIYHRIRRR